MSKIAFLLELKEALISRLNEGRQETLIWLMKHIANGKMHSTESRSSGHSDTSLEALPVKSVLLSAAKRLLIRLCDEDGDETFVTKTVTKRL